jgi:hypothetical protein
MKPLILRNIKMIILQKQIQCYVFKILMNDALNERE